MKREKKIKISERERAIGWILVEEMQNWESTTEVSLGELLRLIKRLSKIK